MWHNIGHRRRLQGQQACPLPPRHHACVPNAVDMHTRCAQSHSVHSSRCVLDALRPDRCRLTLNGGHTFPSTQHGRGLGYIGTLPLSNVQKLLRSRTMLGMLHGTAPAQHPIAREALAAIKRLRQPRRSPPMW